MLAINDVRPCWADGRFDLKFPLHEPKVVGLTEGPGPRFQRIRPARFNHAGQDPQLGEEAQLPSDQATSTETAARDVGGAATSPTSGVLSPMRFASSSTKMSMTGDPVTRWI